MENLSFAELSQLLTAKQQEVEEIRTEFDELKEKFSSLEERFERVIGDAPQVRSNGKAKPAAQFKSLKDFVRDILANSHQPMTTGDIAKEVLKAGYKTTAGITNFANMVQQACSKASDIKRVGKASARPHRYTLC